MFRLFGWLFAYFVLYCFPPLFIVLMVYTLGVRDFAFMGFHKFLTNGLRQFFNR